MCVSVYARVLLCAHSQTRKREGVQRTRQEERQCVSRVINSLQIVDTYILKESIKQELKKKEKQTNRHPGWE